MALPLPDQTYYRMADQVPAASTIAGALNAIYAALTATVDYRGTSLPSTHLWTWARYQNAGTTEAVYNSACPTGTSMALTPAIIFAGSSGAPTPTMLAPDTFVASSIMGGIVKTPGAFNAWDNANPMTSGSFSGYWRLLTTTWNSTGATFRVFIGEESVFVQAYTTATGTTHGWLFIGAVGEPLSTGNGAGESDNRLYGMFGSFTNVSTSWLTTGGSVFNHSTAAGNIHGGVFQPGAGTWYVGGRRAALSGGSTVAETQDTPGAHCGDLMRIGRSSANLTNAGTRLGLLRSVYMYGLAQSGKVLRNGGTDLYHVLACDTTAATTDAMILKAAP